MKIYKIRLIGTDRYLRKYWWCDFEQATTYHSDSKARSVVKNRGGLYDDNTDGLSQSQINNHKIEVVEFDVKETRTSTV